MARAAYPPTTAGPPHRGGERDELGRLQRGILGAPPARGSRWPSRTCVTRPVAASVASMAASMASASVASRSSPEANVLPMRLVARSSRVSAVHLPEARRAVVGDEGEQRGQGQHEQRQERVALRREGGQQADRPEHRVDEGDEADDARLEARGIEEHSHSRAVELARSVASCAAKASTHSEPEGARAGEREDEGGTDGEPCIGDRDHGALGCAPRATMSMSVPRRGPAATTSGSTSAGTGTASAPGRAGSAPRIRRRRRTSPGGRARMRGRARPRPRGRRPGCRRSRRPWRGGGEERRGGEQLGPALPRLQPARSGPAVARLLPRRGVAGGGGDRSERATA